MIKGYWYYTPVVICLAFGYVIGGALSFGVKYLNFLPQIAEPNARFVMMLFGVGILGGTTYSSRFWANDINEVIYENKKKYQPHFFDFVGYLSMMIEGGLTGVILYFLLAGGLIILTGSSEVGISLPSAVIIAYCGGLFHFEVVNRLTEIVKEKLKNGNIN